MAALLKDTTQHEGRKYLRKIRAADDDHEAYVDIYCVLEAYQVTCPAVGHAVKKLLCAGQRGKGGVLADLYGALAAVNRAIQLQEAREEEEKPDEPEGT